MQNKACHNSKLRGTSAGECFRRRVHDGPEKIQKYSLESTDFIKII